MTTAGPPDRGRRKSIGWVIGITVAVAATVALVVGSLSSAPSSEQEPTVNPHPTGALEADLRPKGAAEDALPRYESIVAAIAEDITAVMPGLTWKWNRDPDYVDCTGALADTRGVRVGTRNFLSSSPIPDELWPVVLQVVRDHAAELGAAAEHVYADQPGHHDVAVYGDSGVEIRLLTRGRAVLSAMSDCYLQRRDLSPET